MSDLPNLFTDDTTLTFKRPNSNVLTVISKNELTKFNVWSDSNHLTINIEKTNCQLVTNLAQNNTLQ